MNIITAKVTNTFLSDKIGGKTLKILGEPGILGEKISGESGILGEKILGKSVISFMSALL